MKFKEKTKKHLSVILSILIIATALPMSIFATDIASQFLTGTDAVKTDTDAEIVYSGECGESACWEFDTETGVLTISGEGKVEWSDFIVPWHSFRTGIKKAIIEEGITKIEYEAFDGCSNLVSVFLPNSLTSIGDAVFYGCKSLTEINIPNSVKYIGDYAFAHTSIEEIVVPHLGWCYFDGCKDLKKVIIRSGTTIDLESFSGCESIEDIVIPESVTSVLEYAFSVCKNLRYIHYLGTAEQWGNISISSDGNKNLNNAERHYATLIEKIEPTCKEEGRAEAIYCDACDEYIYGGEVIEKTGEHSYDSQGICTVCSEKCKHENITSNGCEECKRNDVCGENVYWTLDENGTLIISGIGEVTAAPWGIYRKSIKELIIEDGVTSFGGYFGDIDDPMFGTEYYYDALTNVVIGNDVTEIRYWAFAHCLNLKTVHIGDSVEYIGEEAFYGCDSLTTVTGAKGLKSVGMNALSVSSLKEFPFNEGLTSISYLAFNGCDFETVNIPSTVTHIGHLAFTGPKFVVDEENENYSSDEYGVLFNKDKTILDMCPNNIDTTHYTVPESVEVITDTGFAYTDLLNVTITKNVTNINEQYSTPNSLKNIYVVDENENYSDIDGVLFNKDKTILKMYPYGREDKIYVIPDGVVEVEEFGHYYGYRFVETIVVPDSLSYLGGDMSSSSPLNCIHYLGSEEQWSEVYIPDWSSLSEIPVHYAVKVAEVESTCTSEGYTAGVYCPTCDAYVYGHEKIEKVDHIYITHTAKAPTCTEIGWDAYQTCANCDYTTYESVPSTGHATVAHAAKAPTCTEAGWKAYETCENCDYTTYEAVPSTGHSYSKTVTAPTCEKEGYTTYKCDCGDTYVADKVPSTGHSFTNYNSDGNATCIANGTKSAYCDNNCGAKDTQVIENSTTDHADKNNDGSCDECGEKLREDEDNSFFGKIKAFFQRIIDWFRNLFK